MGELWVSHDELVDAIGDDGADLLCRAVGGVSTYIPRKPVAGSPLSAVLGMKRMESPPKSRATRYTNSLHAGRTSTFGPSTAISPRDARHSRRFLAMTP